MENQARTRTKSKKSPARPELEPISYEEIMGNAGMSGFVSFLDSPKPETEALRSLGPSMPPSGATDSATVPEADTVKETPTVQQSKSATVQQSKAVQDRYTVQDSIREQKRAHVKRTKAVEDGH